LAKFNISRNNRLTQDVRPSNCCVTTYAAFWQKRLETPGLGLQLGLGLPFVFTMFLQSLLHSPLALLSRYRRWLNKVSNLKIHRWFC